jgi:NTE family protein
MRSPDGKVGLVLGAGGITGIAWLAGAVRAVQEQTGWDPATADVITGTSAGGVVATVLAAGQDPCDLLRFAEDPEALATAIARATAGRRREGMALPLPGSLPLVASALRTRRLASLSGLLPRGMRSSDEIRGLTHAAAAQGWPTHPRLWLHTCDLRSGRLVTFGRDGAPAASLADAVTASCAVPSYYRPVRIGRRDYIDGGLRSLSNADQLVDERCDTVLILSPFATTDRGALLDTAIFGAARSTTAARTAREAQRLRETGAEVLMIGPTGEDVRAMGLNPMERSRSRLVLETAVESVGRRLAEHRLPVAA